MSRGARILGAEANTIQTLDQELARLARTWSEFSVARMGLLPVDIFLFALTARPLGFTVVSEDLAFATRSLGLYLEALAKRWKVVGEALLTDTVCGITGMVVGEH